MKMAATPCALHTHSTRFAISSLLLLYLQFHECHRLAIISECQTKKVDNQRNISFQEKMQGPPQNLQESCIIVIGICLSTFKRL